MFTQNDIRQVQMAKSAVRAGIDVLAKSWGTELSQIDTVYLAGGFGYGLSIEKACNIGILPREFWVRRKLSVTARSAVASSMPKGRTAMKESVV